MLKVLSSSRNRIAGSSGARCLRATGLHRADHRPSCSAEANTFLQSQKAIGPVADRFSTSAPLASREEAVRNAGTREPTPARVVRVKVGKQPEYLHVAFEREQIMKLDRRELVDALAAHESFRDEFEGARLDKCVVTIVKSISDVPSAEDEELGAVLSVRRQDTVESVVGDDSRFFIRVHVRDPALKILDNSDSTKLLASIRRAVPPEYLRSGDALLHQPRSFTTGQSMLSGVQVGDFLAGGPGAAPPPAFVLEQLKDTRGETLSAMAGGIAERIKLRTQYGNKLAGQNYHSQNNPLVAVQASPGLGKSTALDYASLLTAHKLWSKDLCGCDVTRDILNASAPVAVTYSGASAPDFDHADASLATGLALRILHSFFAPTMRFNDFAKLLPSEDYLSVWEAVKCCLQALEELKEGPRRGILLLVDDVMALDASLSPEQRLRRGRACAVVRELGMAVSDRSPLQLNVVCTSSNAAPFHEMHNRRTMYAPLRPMSQSASERMARKRLHLGDDDALPRAVRVAISDCNGIPALLEHVMREAATLQEAQPETWSADDAALLASLRAAAIRELPAKPELWAIKEALRGGRVGLSRRPDEKMSFAELIEQGVFHNTTANNEYSSDMIVPVLAPLHLLAYEGDKTLEQALKGVADVLPPSDPTTGPSRLQRFVARWLGARLRVAAAAAAATSIPKSDDEYRNILSLGELLLAPVSGARRSYYDRRDCPHDLTPTLEYARLRLLPRRSSVAVEDRRHQTLAKALTEAKGGSGAAALRKNVVYFFGDDNPAFDTLILLPFHPSNTTWRNQDELGPKPSRIALAFDTRSATSTISGGTAKAEAPLLNGIGKAWEQQTKLLVEACGVAPGHCGLVVFTAKEVKATAGTRKSLEDANVMVLGRRHVEALFSPTLAARAFYDPDASTPESSGTPPDEDDAEDE